VVRFLAASVINFIRIGVGPHTTPAIWLPGIVNRSVENVQSCPYTVLDFDGFDDRIETQEEVAAHIRASLALTRWLRDDLDWRLAAILWTGSKSIHAWFHTPSPAVLRTLKDASAELGLDSGLIGNAEHPCRLPGWPHEKTAKRSRTLWLQAPLE